MPILKKLKLTLIFLLSNMIVVSLLSQDLHGTLIVIAKYNSGIVVCSDTRGTVIENHKQIFTFDLKQKIFRLGNNLVAFKGLNSVNDTLLYYYLEKIKDKNLSPKKMIQEVIFTLKNSIPETQFLRLSKETIVYVAGFNGSTPEICYTSSGWKSGGVSDSYVASEPSFDSLQIKSLAGRSLKKIKKQIEKIYSQKSKNDISIGGPTVIWKIEEESKIPICIQNGQDNKLVSVTDIYMAMLNGEIKTEPVAPYDSNYVKSYLIKKLNGD